MKAYTSILRNGIVAATALSLVVVGQASAQKGAGQTAKSPTGQQNTTPGGINQTPWFSNPQVRQQLNFNDNQYNGLNQAYQNAYGNYQKGINNIDPNATPAQRQQQMNQLQQNFHNEFSKSSGQYFSDPAQRERWNQLGWQYRGYNAFSDPAIADKLNLTPDQRAKFDRYHQEWTTQMNKLAPQYQTNQAQATKDYQALQSQYNNNINSVLTPAQQNQWRQMIGNPYSFGPDVYFPSNAATGANSGGTRK